MWIHESPSCKSDCDHLQQACTVCAWNIRPQPVFWGKPVKSISLCGGKKRASQTGTFVLFVSTALIYRAGSMTTCSLQRVLMRCSWFLELMNISCVKQLQQEPSWKSATSEPKLQMCLSVSPSEEMKSLFSFFSKGKSSVHIHIFYTVVSLWKLLFKAKQDIWHILSKAHRKSTR